MGFKSSDLSDLSKLEYFFTQSSFEECPSGCKNCLNPICPCVAPELDPNHIECDDSARQKYGQESLQLFILLYYSYILMSVYRTWFVSQDSVSLNVDLEIFHARLCATEFMRVTFLNAHVKYDNFVSTFPNSIFFRKIVLKDALVQIMTAKMS